MGSSRASAVLGVTVLLGACSSAPAPAPTASGGASATPVPTPSAEATLSAAPEATPFPVRENAEADALFSRPDTCTNREVGYTVTFPDDWYTNTAIGDQAACTWFTPDYFEVGAAGEVPDEIWITIGLVPGIVGYTMLTPTDASEEVEVDGYAGHWAEFRLLEEVTDTESEDVRFHYVVPLDRSGPSLVASTAPDRADDYELAKAVLDRMMASIVLEPVTVEVPTIPDAPTGPPIDGEPVTATDADASFRLTLEAGQDRYRAGQEIEVVATLTYLGPAGMVEARGSSNPGIIGFSIERKAPPVAVHPAYTTDCGSHPMERGVPVAHPFAKSGGFTPDEPLAPFYEAYFADPSLRLPAGTWTITAAGSWSVGDCGVEPHALSAAVTVVVEP